MTTAATSTLDKDAVLQNGKMLGLSENSVTVLMKRYLKKGPDGRCTESPEELFKRVALTVARGGVPYGWNEATVVEEAKRYYDLMVKGIFMPNSPTLMNAGREMGMLSACFVLPIGDSIDEIFDAVKHTALIQKAGGGTGFSFDRLRPTGDYIKSSGGTTSGPLSFWRVLSEATNAIQQGAFRRGANMGMMLITHPDIIKFIFAKQDLSHFQNYNISVKVTDAWMADFRKAPGSPNVVANFRTGKQYVIPKSVDVATYQMSDLIMHETYVGLKDKPVVWTKQDVWDTIIHNAWKTGEPGVCFIDRVNQHNPTPNVGEMEATNPCGEQPLLPFEACNLGSINLGAFVSSDPLKGVNWTGLRDAVWLATRFLENVVEVNDYVIPQIAKVCTENRKIGLGIMGFADALYKLGIGYNTPEGLAMGEKFMKFVNDEAHVESERLAEARGCFKNWTGSRWELDWKRKQRNACSTTVAPTGTISVISNCSGGVEPLFSLVFKRKVMRDHVGTPVEMLEVNEVFLSVAKAAGWWGLNAEDVKEHVLANGTLHGLAIPKDIQRVFVCAHDISPEWHVKMQAAFQKHCDSAISKTTNFPHDASEADVRQIYDLAFDLKCKGVTVYRDGCRDEQPMQLEKKAAPKVESEEMSVLKPCRTPSILSALRLRTRTPFGNMHMTVSLDANTEKELEIFAQIGKAGDIASSDLEAICRMVSLFLRSGGTLEMVIDQLEGIGSSQVIPTRDGQVMSIGDAMGKLLRRYLHAKTTCGLKALLLGQVSIDKPPVELEKAQFTKKVDSLLSSHKLKCPSCDVGALVFMEGCKKCHSCGYSQC